MFRGLKIRTKMLLGYLLIVTLTCFLGVFSLNQTAKVNDATLNMVKNWLPSVFYTSDINTATSDFRIAELQHILSLTKEQMDKYEQDMQRLLEYIQKRQTEYEPLISSAEEKRLYDKFVTNWKDYLAEHDKILPLSRENKNEEAKALIRGNSQKQYDEFSQTLLNLINESLKGADQDSRKADKLYATSRLLVMSLKTATTYEISPSSS